MEVPIDGASLIDSAEPEDHGYQYDAIVIGGGSGGLQFSKVASSFGKKVALCDFVKPSPTRGTTWGLGGTCVNVGCIPKKLMHQAALLGEAMKDSPSYGWNVEPDNIKHDWGKMIGEVTDYIRSLNWGYRVQLRDKKVEYLNALASFVDPHTVECINKQNVVTRYTARRIILAPGGRPKLPHDVPGALEYGITSDDLFWMSKAPGKTLVVGASYVALECAGFIKGLGFDTTVMARSILLRGFDQQMAELIGDYMTNHGTRFIRPAVPLRIEKLQDEKLRVYYRSADITETFEDFDTVVFATGRDADTAKLNLDAAGINNVTSTGHIKVINERTNVPHIYCIGDAQHDRPELTPVAIHTGKLLATRLYANGREMMNYANVATTVFTPLEYGCIGLSEEAAIEKYGADNIEVFHSYFKPLEFTVAHRPENECYQKLICNKTDDNRVIGFHILGPNAGEVTQGYAVAFRLGAKKIDFDLTVGIHPTVSEEFTTMDITKASGKDPRKTGC